MTFSLGIDIGTSGVRTAVIAPDGSVVSMARADHFPQASSIDAELWWKAVAQCLHRQVQALKDAGRDPFEITGAAVDGTSGSMVLTDANIKPVSPGLMYNSKGFDSEAEKISDHAPEPHITRGSNSALARAMRLVAMSDESPTHLMHQADFVAAKLRGRGGFSDHNNALKTGFDPDAGGWPEWIDQVIAPGLLPSVFAVGSPLGQIDPECARAFGLRHDLTVHAGTTDSIAAFLSSAPFEAGSAVTSLGSTLAVKILSRTRIDDPSIGLYSHRVGDMWLVGGASNTGGAVIAQFFGGQEITELSAAMDPHQPTGLEYYPLKEPGERFPINDPNFQPRLSPRPEDDKVFLQAIFEGIAAIEAQCYREIALRGGEPPKRLFSAGGGAGNAAFSMIRQNALGIELETARHTEAAVGAAKLVEFGR